MVRYPAFNRFAAGSIPVEGTTSKEHVMTTEYHQAVLFLKSSAADEQTIAHVLRNCKM